MPNTIVVEWLRRAPAAVARTKHGHALGVLLHHSKHRAPGDHGAGSSWTCRFCHTSPSKRATDGFDTSTQAPSWVYYSFAAGIWM